MPDPVFTTVLSLSFALLWFIACWQKLTAFESFAATLADYRIVPAVLVYSCSVLVTAVEFLIAVGLTVPSTRAAALVGTAALVLVYALAIGVNLLRGRRHIDCGCMGPALRQSLSGWLIVRNLVLAAVALSAIAASARAFVWLDMVTIAGGVVVLAFAYSAINRLIANAPELTRLRNRT